MKCSIKYIKTVVPILHNKYMTSQLQAHYGFMNHDVLHTNSKENLY